MDSAAAAKLSAAVAADDVLVGDLILLELLQGARDDTHAARIETRMLQFEVASLLDFELARIAARNYRKLRNLGYTPRSTADVIIGTYCIERGHSLLHDDRDFAPMQTHLGLRCV